ncbi:hypothetical protein LIER_19769 [Lithospermum erythrorhizon]|uniref:Cupin type-1 domain-containing protein n=1 Tax=Lithospermum erythrorhizon TaxID=34254 RepID=A0AAV3QN91_LITER
MANKSALFVLLVVVFYALVVTVSSYDDERGSRSWEREQEGERGRREEGRGGEGEGGEFLLQDSKHVMKTDAGDMRVVKGFGGRFTHPMDIGFISMEPNSLFIPQYIDSNLIIFVRKGEARLGYIYEGESLAEKQLKNGDIYRIPAGSTFYVHNTAKEQKLHIICSIDTTDSIGRHTFQSFFIGGGTNPTSVLAGFDPQTMATAFNVTIEELKGIMKKQRGGPIVYLDPQAPGSWSKFLDSNKEQKLSQLKSVVHLERKTINEDEQSKWSWRKLLEPLFGEENKKKQKGTTSTGPDAYNIYDRNPDFKNNYGWSMALDEEDYSPLTCSGIGLYLVNLTAGSMMAPHVNPMATEYGIVLRGSGTIQVVHPNGSLAMKAKVEEGDVFFVPRYFPFCQIASRKGPFEFFGFTTSARKNMPQFLVGANSLLQTMMSPELAAAFGVSEKRLRSVIDAQRETTILPSAFASSPGVIPRPGEEHGREIPEVIRSLGNEMIIGFN